MIYLFVLLISILIWSISNIVVYGKIFSPIRDWVIVKSDFFGSLLSCIQCSSFWIGSIFSLFFVSLTRNTLGDFGICNYILDGFLLSGTSMIIEIIYIKLSK